MGKKRVRAAPPTMDVHRVTIGGEELTVLSFAAPVAPRTLTKAERFIAQRVARGESNAEIARARKSSPRTVANQLQQIFRKLGVASRAELSVCLRRGR